MSNPSETAGVAMITSFIEFFTSGSSPGLARMTWMSPSSLASTTCRQPRSAKRRTRPLANTAGPRADPFSSRRR